jgi:putative redox protein
MKAQHEITVAYDRLMEFTAHIGPHSFKIDAPESGPGEGPSPKKLMLASLAGCTGLDVVSILQKMKVSFSDFKIDVQATLTEEHPTIYQEVEVHYYIKTDISNQSKMERAVQLSEKKYCGVMEMFRTFAKVSTHIHYV